ncbi:MAG: hypothetical protein CR985_01170 [Flavobacteriales bacterium]|nr:MAG: hypothetical protein CR985_01170 [Flavobacteriales bacterium]
MVINELKYKKNHITNSSVFKTIDSVKNKIEVLGFINANIDTIISKDTTYLAIIKTGNPYKKTKIYNYQDIKQIPVLKNFYSSHTAEYITLATERIPFFLNTIVAHYEHKGFPFVAVRLQHIKVENGEITAELVVDTGTKRKIDKIKINGYKNFPKHLFPIGATHFYSNEALNRLRSQIRQLPFVSETKSPETLFTPDSTIVYLYLKKETANSIDGLIGFNRNAATDKLQLNGYADLMLSNLFNAGESFTLKWNNNGQNRQDFKTNIFIPHIFKSKFSTYLTLNIIKQDTSFATTNFKISIPYQINLKNNLGLSYKYLNSVGLLENNNLYDVSDFSGSFTGINYIFSNLNPTPFLENSFNFNAEILYGNRKSVLHNGSQWFLSSSINSTLPVFKRSYIYLTNEIAWLYSDFYLDNELLRLGGINTLRGFSYNSILASFYSTLTAEYRLLTNTNDYLFSITDIATTQNKKLKKTTNYVGIGLGYSFKTIVGNVNLSYAIGNTFNEGFSFKNGQLQIKIVNRF